MPCWVAPLSQQGEGPVSSPRCRRPGGDGSKFCTCSAFSVSNCLTLSFLLGNVPVPVLF